MASTKKCENNTTYDDVLRQLKELYGTISSDISSLKSQVEKKVEIFKERGQKNMNDFRPSKNRKNPFFPKNHNKILDLPKIEKSRFFGNF